MTPSELEQLKQKYPLAFDTIKLPVRYVDVTNCIIDNEAQVICRIEKPEWGNSNYERPQRQDEIGLLIEELLNQAI